MNLSIGICPGKGCTIHTLLFWSAAFRQSVFCMHLVVPQLHALCSYSNFILSITISTASSVMGAPQIGQNLGILVGFSRLGLPGESLWSISILTILIVCFFTVFAPRPHLLHMLLCNHLAPSNLLFATSNIARSFSIPMYFLAFCKQATPIDPLPMQQSSTVSSGFV